MSWVGKDNITVALAQYSAKKSDQKKYTKKSYWNTCGGWKSAEVVKKKRLCKKKDWIILAVNHVRSGISGNWLGTQKLLNLEPSDKWYRVCL